MQQKQSKQMKRKQQNDRLHLSCNWNSKLIRNKLTSAAMLVVMFCHFVVVVVDVGVSLSIGCWNASEANRA